MKNFQKTAAILAIIGLVGALGACGDPEQEENQNQLENQNQESDAGTDTEEADAGDVPSKCDGADDDLGPNIPADYEAQTFDSDYDLRVTEFIFQTGSPGAPLLNPIVTEALDDQTLDYPVVVLLELREIDIANESLEVRGGAGLKADTIGEYRWDDALEKPDLTVSEIHESGAFYARLPLLNFVATIETETDPVSVVIPIRDLNFDGQLQAEANGSTPTIRESVLSGIVVAEEVEDVTIPIGSGLTMEQLLGPDAKNFDFNCDGQADSWRLSADLEADETVIVE